MFSALRRKRASEDNSYTCIWQMHKDRKKKRQFSVGVTRLRAFVLFNQKADRLNRVPDAYLWSSLLQKALFFVRGGRKSCLSGHWTYPGPGVRQHPPIPGWRAETTFRARGHLWRNQSLLVSAHAVCYKGEPYSLTSTLENSYRHTQQTSMCEHGGLCVAGRKVIGAFT